MRRLWNLRRTARSDPNGQYRWDRAYQLLLGWTQPMPRSGELPAPQTPHTPPDQEVRHESGNLCPCLHTQRQAQTQTIDQQLERLQGYAQQQDWALPVENQFRHDGYSGATLKRPGLDRLRDRVADRELDLILITAPDRLARHFVHQCLLLEEIEKHGCRVQFLDRPMSQDPHDQLLLQIRGAVAEFERSLISDRMRRGRQRKLEAGLILPWKRPLYGYRMDPEHPREPSGIRIEESEAAVVRDLFAWYAEDSCSFFELARRLDRLGIPSPTGLKHWNL